MQSLGDVRVGLRSIAQDIATEETEVSIRQEWIAATSAYLLDGSFHRCEYYRLSNRSVKQLWAWCYTVGTSVRAKSASVICTPPKSGWVLKSTVNARSSTSPNSSDSFCARSAIRQPTTSRARCALPLPLVTRNFKCDSFMMRGGCTSFAPRTTKVGLGFPAPNGSSWESISHSF